MSRTSRITSGVLSLAKKAVDGEPGPAVRKGDGGYTDWIIVAMHGLREFLDRSYRQLHDVLHEISWIASKLGLVVAELPDITNDCAGMQDLETPLWSVLLRLSADLHEVGGIQAIDGTGFDQRDAAVATRNERITPIGQSKRQF